MSVQPITKSDSNYSGSKETNTQAKISKATYSSAKVIFLGKNVLKHERDSEPEKHRGIPSKTYLQRW